MELQRGRSSLDECQDTEQVQEQSVVYGLLAILLLNLVLVLFLVLQRLSKEQIRVREGRPTRCEGHKTSLEQMKNISYNYTT